MNTFKLNILFISLFFSSHSIFAQIGINTENPLALFHIHTQSDTTAGALDVSDDIMFTSEGNMGIGILPDNTAKLQIDTDNDVMGLKLEDGNQGVGKIMGVLNTLGDVGWIKAPTSWALISYLTTPMVIPRSTTYDFYQSPPVPESGDYLVTIRWIGKADCNASALAVISSYFYMFSSTSKIDGIEYYLPFSKKNSIYTFSVFLRGHLNAGENITLKINVSVSSDGGIYNWLTGTEGTDITLNPSVLIFKF